MAISKQDSATAQEILRLIDATSPERFSELNRVLDLGIPMATLVNSGQIDSLSPAGRETLENTLAQIRAYLDAASVGKSERERWQIGPQ